MATITSSLIRRRLQIANCAAAIKGYNYLVNYAEKGRTNQAELDEIETLLSLIDSIVTYAQYTTQASYVFTVTASVIASVTTISVNGVVLGTVTSATGVASTHAQEINNFINGLRTYTSSVSGAIVTINGITGAAANTYAVAVTASGGNTFTLPSPQQLAGGVDIIGGTTCITTAQMSNILDKLCQICDAPCTTYVNFN